MGGIFEIIDEDGIDRTITQKSTEENTLFVNELSRSSIHILAACLKFKA